MIRSFLPLSDTLFSHPVLIGEICIMAVKEITNKQKKEYAKLLFTTTDLTQKEIAERVGTSPQSMTKWVSEGMWDSLRKSLLTSKSDQLRRMYEIANAVTTKIESTQGGFGDTKLADMMIKYTAAIKNLETETSAGQMFEFGMQFIRFVSVDSIPDAQLITDYFDGFIQKVLNAKF